MDGSIAARIDDVVDDWLRWLPKWRPGTHTRRTRLCRTCFGSPVIRAAGLITDVPHAVQHALSMRVKLVIDDAVDAYTEAALPLLSREIRANEERKASMAGYHPAAGLDPEYTGLELDPPAEREAPYLFTFAELAHPDSPSAFIAEPPPLTAAEKTAIRAELRLADEYAAEVGGEVCSALYRHRERMLAAVDEFVEPWVQALLADLDSTLDSPLWPRTL